MKAYLFSFLFILFSVYSLSAQNQLGITGVIVDGESQEPIELVGIKVLNKKDSTFVKGGITDDNGKFTVSVSKGKYIVQAFYLGYADTYTDVEVNNKRADLGNVVLNNDGILLSEAVVIGKTPDMVVKGDTIEYNADSYKVQESAVLQDLIKRIPGAEIGANGKITINGKDISKILVDGKEFFSDDPTTASQNLPARIVEKLQVLDKKSDMAQLTGFDDGEEETVINLTIKPGMKTGVMANAMIGYGNKDRYEGNGFLNYAKDNTRISAFGNINNNNNVNSGGPGGGGRGDGDSGLTKTSEGGINLALEPSTKFKLDGDLYYGYRDNDVSSKSSKEYIAAVRSEQGTSWSKSKSENIRSRFRMEWTPDSLTKIIFRPNLSYSTTDSYSNSLSSILNEEIDLNNIDRLNRSSSDGNTLRMNGFLMFNRKLNNKGRSITVGLSGGFNNGETDSFDYTEETYTKFDSTAIIDQKTRQDNDSYNWRVRLSYLEPIGNNNFLQLSYSLRNSYSETDKIVHSLDNVTQDYTHQVDSVSRNTKNRFLNQNITLAFQSHRQKFNYTIGFGLEPSSSKTEIATPNQQEDERPRRNFLNIAPRMEFNYLWDKRHNLRLIYFGYTSEPSSLQLYDGIISQSGSNKTIGNPNLRPTFTNRVMLRYQRSLPASATSMKLDADFAHNSNDIVTISRWEGAGNIKTYQNIDGNMNGNIRYELNTPLRNKKFTVTTTTYGRYTRDNTFISSGKDDPKKNTANVYRAGESLRLKFNSDAFQFDLGGNFAFEKTGNSLSNSQNQTVYDFGGMGSFTWYLPLSFTLESDMNYSSNAGYNSGYQQNQWLWNASLSKQFLKGNRGTVRFKMYDILQERSSVSRSSTAEYIQYSVNNTISSYFMVNFIYRFDSFKGGAKASDFERPQRGPGGGGFRRGPGGRF